jgi:2-enoate reductase
METAYWLSYEKDCKVQVVEMLENIEEGACTANRCHLIHYFEANGGELLNCSKVVSFAPGIVKISRNISKGVPDPYCTWTPVLPKNIENPLAPKIKNETYVAELPCDLVVLAMGGRADDKGFLAAQQAGVAPEIYDIGDSFNAGRVLEANRAAYNLARII